MLIGTTNNGYGTKFELHWNAPSITVKVPATGNETLMGNMYHDAQSVAKFVSENISTPVVYTPEFLTEYQTAIQ